MSVSRADWADAVAFLTGLGLKAEVLERPEFQEQVLAFLNLLLQKNEVLNLTGAKDMETLFWKHFVDSLTLLYVEDLGAVVDWGSGGGFPAVPVALYRRYSGDRSPVHFLDSIGKKVRAVEEFCAALALSNALGHIGRGEELLKSRSLGRIDSIVMRAVAPASRAVKWIRPFGRQWILLLGPSQVDEWRSYSSELARSGMRITDEKKFLLPRGLGERSLLRISKCST